ncbi:hypothetical protein DITRI_Ditri12bG0076500 [Diplodiscus trichospermus]
MRPVMSHERPPTRSDLMINGLRPSPLKISKDSHFIQKTSGGVVSLAAAASHSKQQGPVIIYTHSPKIIHTQARDFMALVQKLTGFSRSDDVNETGPSRPRKNKAEDNSVAGCLQEENDSSSAVTDENGGLAVSDAYYVNNVSSPYVPATISPINPLFADIPLFTPNSTDFCCSPRHVYKFADNATLFQTLGNLNSPSMIEFIKGLPDY